MGFTLQDIHELALTYVPLVARWTPLLDGPDWGPAHEIGHVLAASPFELTQVEFGLPCTSLRCSCPMERCFVVELAAMRVSRALVTMAGAPAESDVEVEATAGYDIMWTRENWRDSWRLLRDRRVPWPLPRTRAGLERLLSARVPDHLRPLAHR